ncbi:MAG TPA: hypothetical protein PLL93_15765, partial [bacterium]|nr:hypothetical protein [bacterium]
KKNKIDLIMGTARLKAGNHVVVKGNDGTETVLQYKNVIIATGVPQIWEAKRAKSSKRCSDSVSKI